MSEENETLKCVVVGDGTVGKTCLLIRYAKDEFPSDYVPTIFDSYAVSLPVGDETFELRLFDTAGQEDYDQLRKLAFTDTDILLVCFAVDSRRSFDNVRDMWIPELRKYCPGVPYILVGTKIDVRSSTHSENLITKEQGVRLASELRAVEYVECSALTKQNVNDVFQEAIIAALSDNHRPTSVSDSRPKIKPTPVSTTSTSSFSNTAYNAHNANNAPATSRNNDDDDSCCKCVIA